jgi:hypothetical protein
LKSLLALAVGVIFLACVVPFFALSVTWDELRLRKSYRRQNRLLDWNEAQQALASGEGTFIVEVCANGTPGHVWYVMDDLLGKCPDCPLLPAKVLLPTSDRYDELLRLGDLAAEAWWEAHKDELEGSVSLVRMPLSFGRNQWQELLSASNALAVHHGWTLSFYKHRFYLFGLRLPY